MAVHITQGDHEGKGVIVSWVTVDEPGDLGQSYDSNKTLTHYEMNPQKGQTGETKPLVLKQIS
ncbi:hypothetical protein Tsubulata_006820 [Turnera subulata]|uniref:Uncharacterized protein n=1 Tax=Turnera subulata TaxID=218843 RepID=A0A9Q0J3Y3_9ROSI|nr:hypothetical protein Tsubulata_006820 [Turnera subulata]